MERFPVGFNWLFISRFLTDYSTLNTLKAMGNDIRWQVHLLGVRLITWWAGRALLSGGNTWLGLNQLWGVSFIVHSLTGLTWELAQSAPVWAVLCYPICIVSPCSNTIPILTVGAYAFGAEGTALYLQWQPWRLYGKGKQNTWQPWSLYSLKIVTVGIFWDISSLWELFAHFPTRPVLLPY